MADRKHVRFNLKNVPLHKEPGWLWDTIERWMKSCETSIKTGEIPDCLKSLLTIDLRNEVDWLKNRLEKENSPVVFCHNDMQEGNILIRQDGEKNNNEDDPEIVVIDFEYCSYNYRSFDIANHFVEWIYDYTNSKHPFYHEDARNYPTKQQRLDFIKTYLDERNSSENPKKVMREVEVFTLASHFFWGLWGIINATTSQIPFGYSEYSASRFNHYFRLKNKLSLDMKSLGLSLPAKRKSSTLE